MRTLVQYKDATAIRGQTPCELCANRPARVNDHCHAHGWVRGALCGSCNALLGCIENDRGFRTDISLSLIADFLARCPDCPPRTVVTPDPLIAVRFTAEAATQLRRLTRQVSARLDRNVPLSDVLTAVADLGLENIAEIAALLPRKGTD